ncbi:MAG: DUF1579 domain-containing protein [Rubrivivax sp.]|nr:DUF1579 domain-containing protein [Rubrivivax sp.]
MPNGNGAHDFDFLVGHWQVRHRRLKERLEGCAEWQEFEGTSTLRPLMDGRGNVDDNVIDLPAGRYRAISMRSFDPAKGLWAIWWLDERHPHQLDAPVVGRFEGGIGTFFADDQFKGRPIRVRFLWTDITADSARWQQAFSEDGGRTWETNWVMDLRRADAT